MPSPVCPEAELQELGFSVLHLHFLACSLSIPPRLLQAQSGALVFSAFLYGHQVLQWPGSPLPHKEGPASALESSHGEWLIFLSCPHQIGSAFCHHSFFWSDSRRLERAE